MIQIYECTDCGHCANFSFRVICTNPKINPDDVDKYEPVGSGDASDCDGFDYSLCLYYSDRQWEEAEVFSIAKYGDVTYQGVRDYLVSIQNR